jgi:tetratricopeptide (TPR) repeat protein
MRITVNLVRVFDRKVIWTAEYAEEVEQVFEVQERITRRIVQALRGELTASAPATAAATHDLEALTLYLQGRYAWYRRTPDALREARALLEESVRRDPGFGLAHVGLADLYNVMGGVEYAMLPPADAQRMAMAAAFRALEIEPALGEAHAALGSALLVRGGRYAEAEAHFVTAIRHNPGYAAAHHGYTLCLLALGRMDEALESIHRARLLDPLSAAIASALARTLYLQRRYADAAAENRRALELDPTLLSARLGLAMVLIQMDSVDAAYAEVRRAAATTGDPAPLVVALSGYLEGRSGDQAGAAGRLRSLEQATSSGRYIPPEYFVLAYLGLGRYDEAIDRVEQSVRGGSAWAMTLPVDPVVDPLRGKPRFDRLVAGVVERHGRPDRP